MLLVEASLSDHRARQKRQREDVDGQRSLAHGLASIRSPLSHASLQDHPLLPETFRSNSWDLFTKGSPCTESHFLSLR